MHNLKVRNVDTLIIFTDLLTCLNRALIGIADHDRDAIGVKAAELFDALTADGDHAQRQGEDLHRARNGVEIGVIERQRINNENSKLRNIDVTQIVRDIIAADPVGIPGDTTVKSARLIITR